MPATRKSIASQPAVSKQATSWSHSLKRLARACGSLLLLSAITFLSPLSQAETSSGLTALEPSPQQSAASTLNLRWSKSYALGVDNYRLDHATKVTGWQLGERWYFGRQKGLDSGITLVWQRQTNQVSFSKDGIRLTRHF